MGDLLTTLYDHYHVPFVDRRLGNIIERDHQKLIKELSNRQRKLVLEIIDCKDSYVEEAAIDGFKSGFRLAARLMQEVNTYDTNRPVPMLGEDDFVILGPSTSRFFFSTLHPEIDQCYFCGHGKIGIFRRSRLRRSVKNPKLVERRQKSANCCGTMTLPCCV